MDKREDGGIVTVSSQDDAPVCKPGLLIPECLHEEEEVVEEMVSAGSSATVKVTSMVMVTAMLMFMLALGVTTYVTLLNMEQTQNVASPIIVVNEEKPEPEAITYGSKVSFSEPGFFAEIKDALLLSNSTFIEANLETMELRLYERGEEKFQAQILSKGDKGSLSETPAGLYVIEEKETEYRSPESGATHPWSMLFQGNFYIHGQPYFADDVENPEPHIGGGIRLSDADAEQLFAMVDVDTTILVHEEAVATDSFVYEPTVPEVTAEHYLVVDIANNTVLAGSDMDKQVPIASLTKLMTAMVAIENFNIEDVVYLAGSQYPSTTIPRLAGEDAISVYDLLRLMLVESSNEAANVVADKIGRAEFVALMNDKAESLGLENTTFTDPSGLSAGNTSTLRDLLHFTKYLYNNRSFILKVTADSDLLQVVSGMNGLHNFNDVDGDDSFVAGKVGETKAAGKTSISLHKITVKGEERVIAVIILGSESRTSDVLQLTKYVNERFSL